ncbi:hypothetical protein GCM10028822_08260 [Hymenobacter terrigena]
MALFRSERTTKVGCIAGSRKEIMSAIPLVPALSQVGSVTEYGGGRLAPAGELDLPRTVLF